MANNTYQTNWNVILNALPKAQRKAFKLQMIAAIERQKVGTNSYRPLNIYNPNASTGSPWNIDPNYNSNAINNSNTDFDNTLALLNSIYGNNTSNILNQLAQIANTFF